jgi:tetratricopeptide (TPR) repeat protein
MTDDRRPTTIDRRAAALLLMLLAGCTVPFNWFGRKPPPPTPRPSNWESDTAAGAKAFQEGRLEEAERQLEVARERAASGTDNQPEVAASLVNLAVVRRAQGDVAGALQLQQEALAVREKQLGPEHPDVATSLNSIAALYSAQDDYAAAAPLLVRALAIREKALGPDDRRTAQSLNNLALLYAAEGHYAEAEPLYQRAVAIFEQRQESNELATVLENYAALLDETGRVDAAREMDARARSLRATDVHRQKGVTGDR